MFAPTVKTDDAYTTRSNTEIGLAPKNDFKTCHVR
jgi:hypothetical protein